MKRLLAVIRREYVERVRTKAFLIGTLLGPLVLGGMSIGPSLLMTKQRGKPLRIAVVDETGRLSQAIESALAERKSDGSERFEVLPSDGAADGVRLEGLKRDVLAGRLDGYVHLPTDALERSQAEYFGKNVSNMMDLGLLDRVIQEQVHRYRLAGAGIAPESIAALTRRLDVKHVKLSERGEREDHGASFLLAFMLLMALYSTVGMWGAALMNSVIEEKTSRVVEVIVSSVPTTTLFSGKLIGVGAVGLTQLLAWSVLIGGLGLVASQGGASLPDVPPHLLFAFPLFFLLGFFFYGALFTAVGAAVNSQQEAQSLTFTVMMPMIVAIMCFPAVLNSPDSPLAVGLSLVPFWTPLLMFLRMAVQTPPLWQIALSVVLMLAAIVGANWAAARIYRVGILMHGKRPTLPEILRWVRR